MGKCKSMFDGLFSSKSMTPQNSFFIVLSVIAIYFMYTYFYPPVVTEGLDNTNALDPQLEMFHKVIIYSAIIALFGYIYIYFFY